MTGRRTILVVEDEPEIVEIVQLNLEAAGYRVVGAEDWVEGLRQIRALRPDLLLLDLMLPGTDGWRALEEVRADPATTDLPVVVLSCEKTDRTILRALFDGAADYVTKPFDPSVLEAVVSLAIAKAHRERPSGTEPPVSPAA